MQFLADKVQHDRKQGQHQRLNKDYLLVRLPGDSVKKRQQGDIEWPRRNLAALKAVADQNILSEQPIVCAVREGVNLKVGFAPGGSKEGSMHRLAEPNNRRQRSNSNCHQKIMAGSPAASRSGEGQEEEENAPQHQAEPDLPF